MTFSEKHPKIASMFDFVGIFTGKNPVSGETFSEDQRNGMKPGFAVGVVSSLIPIGAAEGSAARVLGMFKGAIKGAFGKAGAWLTEKLGMGAANHTGAYVIGETMKRVQTVASHIPGSKILDDMPDFKAMGQSTQQVTSSMMQYNRKWILEALRSGKPMVDIGVDPSRANPSIFYQMEQNMVKNYQKLHPEWNNLHPVDQ